jgi:hypothetical protein
MARMEKRLNCISERLRLWVGCGGLDVPFGCFMTMRIPMVNVYAS